MFRTPSLGMKDANIAKYTVEALTTSWLAVQPSTCVCSSQKAWQGMADARADPGVET